MQATQVAAPKSTYVLTIMDKRLVMHVTKVVLYKSYGSIVKLSLFFLHSPHLFSLYPRNNPPFLIVTKRI